MGDGGCHNWRPFWSCRKYIDRSDSKGDPILAATDLLVFIRMLIFLTADFGCVTKKSCAPKIEQESNLCTGFSLNSYAEDTSGYIVVGTYNICD
jgi:hypothetical protein